MRTGAVPCRADRGLHVATDDPLRGDAYRPGKSAPQEAAMTILDVILRHAVFVPPDGSLETTLEAWEATGLDAHEVEEWMSARCFVPDAARDLADAGVTPGMARLRTSAGGGAYVDTIGFKVANGDLGVDEARELVGAL
jgi:hypothetical protein